MRLRQRAGFLYPPDVVKRAVNRQISASAVISTIASQQPELLACTGQVQVFAGGRCCLESGCAPAIHRTLQLRKKWEGRKMASHRQKNGTSNGRCEGQAAGGQANRSSRKRSRSVSAITL
jgi:hypothetical protein